MSGHHDDPDDIIHIESTRDRHDMGPACLITWGQHQWYAPVDDIYRTAEDLFTAAAYGDVLGELINIGLPKNVIETMVSSMLSRAVGPRVKAIQKATRQHWVTLGLPSTLAVAPVASSRQKVGAVSLRKGKVTAAIGTEQAREMGRHWMQTAAGCDTDTLIDAVLHRTGLLGGDDIDAVFALVMDIRNGDAELPPAREENSHG